MATARAALKTYLNADATLAALLTGGVKDEDDFTFDEGGANEVPRETDGVRIKPFAYVRWRVSNVTEIIAASERQTVQLYLYQRSGKSTIESAVKRLKTLLHRHQLTADDKALLMFHYQMSNTGLPPADELGGASMGLVQFYTDFTRR